MASERAHEGGLIARLWLDYGAKLLRYCGVSVFNVIFGQGLLYLFHGGLHWSAWIANVAAVGISAIPAYLLSRHYVWGQSGPNSLRSEVLPFWIMAFIGLALSTVVIAVIDRRWGGDLSVALASLCSFGVVWLAKFFVLDKWMWKHAQVPATAPATPQ